MNVWCFELDFSWMFNGLYWDAVHVFWIWTIYDFKLQDIQSYLQHRRLDFLRKFWDRLVGRVNKTVLESTYSWRILNLMCHTVPNTLTNINGLLWRSWCSIQFKNFKNWFHADKLGSSLTRLTTFLEKIWKSWSWRVILPDIDLASVRL